MKAVRIILASALAAAAMAGAPANAATYVLNLPEFNGTGAYAPTAIGSFTKALAPGETVASASFSSTFGNSVISSTAIGQLTLDGVLLATCTSSDPCYNGGQQINYNFAPTQLNIFADGISNLVYNQTGCCVIRLGASTLTLNTVAAAVPEPATWAMMILGMGAVGFAMRRRSKVATTVRFA